jgi:ribonuclease T2
MTVGTAGLLLAAQSHASSQSLQGYVLDIQLTPAVCALDHSTNKLRRCLEGYSLTINGLIPETSQPDCATTSSPYLPPLQAKVVARVMPEESTRNRLWYSIGGCVPMNASQYFRNMINKADELKIPLDLTEVENKTVQKFALTHQFIRLNPKMSNDSIRYTCSGKGNKAVLTGIKICYKVNGQYKRCSEHVVENCPTTFSIKGSY